MPQQFEEKLKNACAVARVSRIANLTKLDSLDFPTFQVLRPFSKNYVCSMGKAPVEAMARVSAIMESLEGYHSEILKPECRASVAAMASQLTYSPQELGPFQPETECGWVTAYDLFARKKTKIPHLLVCLDFTVDYPDRHVRIKRTSNGIAGGVTHSAALQHALLEAMERHAITTGKAVRVPFDVSLIPLLNPYFDRMRAQGFKMAIFFYENCFHLPACRVKIWEPGTNLLIEGLSCHPDKWVCVRKAYEEALQSRLGFISGARDDFTYRSYGLINSAPTVRPAVRQAQDLGAVMQWGDICDLGDTYAALGDSEKVEFLLARIRAARFQNALVVDLKQPDIDLDFVFAVVPGFQMRLEYVH